MVAKTYQNLPTVGDVYTQNGRKYIQVRTTNGTLKKVRWYNEKEYARMYPDEVNTASKENNSYFKTQKEVLGFSKGYITIFRGNTFEDKEYFKLSSARYTHLWGWYFVSDEPLPTDIPEDVEAITLPWELVGNEDGSLKTENAVIAAVESLIYEPDESEYQGEIGDKIDVIVTVEKTIPIDGYYGPSTLYSMKDENKNVYIWITTSVKTRLEEKCSYKIRGTVKEHKQYKAQKQTILTRCVVIK